MIRTNILLTWVDTVNNMIAFQADCEKFWNFEKCQSDLVSIKA